MNIGIIFKILGTIFSIMLCVFLCGTAAAFLLGDNGKVTCDEDFIFYNNLSSRDDAVVHTGDNLTGDGDGDDEVIMIDFTKIPSNVSKIAITVTIHDAINRKQNFGQVSNAYVHVAKMASDADTTGEEVLRFDLVEDFSIETAIVVCEIYKNGNDWKIENWNKAYENRTTSGRRFPYALFCLIGSALP